MTLVSSIDRGSLLIEKRFGVIMFKHCGKHHNQYPESATCAYCDAEQAIEKDQPDINKLTKAELVELGIVHGLELKDSMTKQDMIDAIRVVKETDANSKS